MKKLLVTLGIAALSTGAMAQGTGEAVLFNADNGHYYQRFVYSNLYNGSWQQAQDFAVSQGGNLVSITSQSEQDFIDTNYRYYNTNSLLGLLTGGHKVNGSWVWSDGSAWTYSKWWPGQPDAWGGQDVMHYVGNSGTAYIGATYWDDYWGNQTDGLNNFGYYGYSGFIVEWNYNPTNNAVPEPSEWAAMGLLGAGLLGLVVKGRKNQSVTAK